MILVKAFRLMFEILFGKNTENKKKVWLVQHKETLINYGLFESKEKAERYIDYSDRFNCMEIEIK